MSILQQLTIDVEYEHSHGVIGQHVTCGGAVESILVRYYPDRGGIEYQERYYCHDCDKLVDKSEIG